ncbi:hypothetical protein JCM14076_27550 [Methylosoma difficile]
MPDIKNRPGNHAMAYWSVAALLTLALKQGYSAASAAQLQWQLYPLVVLLELFSHLSFEAAGGEWRDDFHRVSIVKSCAGINFLIVSLLGYWWLWRDRPFGVRSVLYACTCAWLTALLANTLRILLSIYGQDALSTTFGLTEPESHRLIGIAVYFFCIWAQLSAFRWRRFRQTASIATLIYLTVTLLIPVLRALVLGRQLPDWPHIAWVLGLPLLTLLISRSLRRQYKYPT